MTEDTGEMVELVNRMVNLCWGGCVPDKVHDAAVVNALLVTCFPPNLGESTRKDLAFELAQALDLFRRQRNCRWSN